MSAIQNFYCYIIGLWYNKIDKQEKTRGGGIIGVTITSGEYVVLKSLFGVRLAEYKVRTGQRFDRKEAALKTGLSLSHLSGVFNGNQFTSTENLFILAKMLGCRVDDLYVYEEEYND